MLESLELGKFERKNFVDFISRKIELSLILIIYSTLAKIYIYITIHRIVFVTKYVYLHAIF